MIPLLHDFSGQRVLVVGGGPVAARKARRFAREADAVVVAPDFDETQDFENAGMDGDPDVDGAQDDGTIELVRARVDADAAGDWLDRVEPALVVAATDDAAVNEALAAAARERGILVNRTDRSGEREPGSVVVPATVRDGPVTIAVATDGTSPAVSKALRKELADELDGVGALAERTAALRRDLAERDLAPDRRRSLLRAVVRSERVWTALGTGGAKVEQAVDAAESEQMGDSS